MAPRNSFSRQLVLQHTLWPRAIVFLTNFFYNAPPPRETNQNKNSNPPFQPQAAGVARRPRRPGDCGAARRPGDYEAAGAARALRGDGGTEERGNGTDDWTRPDEEVHGTGGGTAEDREELK